MASPATSVFRLQYIALSRKPFKTKYKNDSQILLRIIYISDTYNNLSFKRAYYFDSPTIITGLFFLMMVGINFVSLVSIELFAAF
ncbi:hypothetical protein C8D85_2638 [Marinomonas communis]|uniref:Uncharacterized protein n=1 Tax=Marinomonas communis TaxID=28254 RepID=A0A4R6X790_9GAMM|nr:hypothetical protein C8D85_2638 [Marinomonas communis]